MIQRKRWASGRDTATAWLTTDTATPQEEEGEAGVAVTVLKEMFWIEETFFLSAPWRHLSWKSYRILHI